MKFSIIIPVYNPDINQLKFCLSQITQQEFDGYEVIIINDGSKKEIEIYLNKICKNNSLFVLVNQENQGCSAARNAGLLAAKGEYIVFLDSDDWLEKDTLKYLNSVVDDNNDFIQFAYSRDYISGSRRICRNYETVVEYNFNKKGNIFDPYDVRNSGMIWGKCYKRQFIAETRFDINLTNGEDVEFNMRLFKRLKKATYYPEIFYHYIQNDDSAVRKIDENMIIRYKRTLDKMCKYIESDERYKKATEIYYSFCAITYLMLCLNYFFSKRNPDNLNIKFRKHNQFMNNQHMKAMLRNIKKIKLPFSRKVSIYFAKMHLNFLTFIVIKVKEQISK